MKLFTNANHNVLSLDDFKLFCDMDSYSFPDKNTEHGKALIALADQALSETIPQLYLSMYSQFARIGNRRTFEAEYFKRRTMLVSLIIGELVSGEGKYLSKIIDILYLILEETTWVIPAHNKKRADENSNEQANTDHSNALPISDNYDKVYTYIDLFSAETCSVVAVAYYFFKDKFDADLRELLCSRILYEIDVRITKPFLKYDDIWWMGVTAIPNNWNPWIISNILFCTALTQSDTNIRKAILNKSLLCVDRFIDNYNEDGGCDEGPGYWRAAGGALFDVLEIAYDMTGGDADYFNTPLIYNMFDYIRKVHIEKNYFACFADAHVEAYTDGMQLAMRMAAKTKNDALYNFASSLTSPDMYIVNDLRAHSYRLLKNICTPIPESKEFSGKEFDCLQNLQVAIIRRKNHFSLATKGGHNGESHNHNDVGNFAIHYGGNPFFIDIGAPTYTKDLFSPKRYSIFPVDTPHHNLPVVNGIGQGTGANYRADKFDAEDGKVRIEYQGAYKAEAGVVKCVREIEYIEDGIVVSEAISTKGGLIEFNYYLNSKPVLQNGNTYTFGNGAKIICPDSLSHRIDNVSLNDQTIIKDWQTDTFYKLVISTDTSTDISFKLTIKH